MTEEEDIKEEAHRRMEKIIGLSRKFADLMNGNEEWTTLGVLMISTVAYLDQMEPSVRCLFLSRLSSMEADQALGKWDASTRAREFLEDLITGSLI